MPRRGVGAAWTGGPGRRAALATILTAMIAAGAAGCGHRGPPEAVGTPSAPRPGGGASSSSSTAAPAAPSATPTAQDAEGAGGASVSTGAPAATGTPGEGPQLWESRDDLIDPQPLAWSSWQEVEPGVIEVTFLTGPASCLGVRASVDQGPERVTINLAQGTYPGADETCRAIAVRARMRILLDRPLDGRGVVQNGASAAPHDG